MTNGDAQISMARLQTCLSRWRCSLGTRGLRNMSPLHVPRGAPSSSRHLEIRLHACSRPTAQDSAESLAFPLTHIFNRSLAIGVFSRLLKDSTVIPLFQNKGKREDLENHRPISLFDYLSKVLEGMVVR